VRMLEHLKERALLYCYWVGDSLKRVLVIVSVSAFSISVAVFLYGLLYWAVLPSTALAIPVRFTFSSCATVGEPCSYITSHVKLSQKKLLPGLKYNLELVLEVPDSSTNREVGMFLTCTRFVNELSTGSSPSSCTSAVIPFKAPLVSLVESLLLLPLHLTGLVTGSSLVRISLLEDHMEEPSSPSTALEVEVQTSRLQIHSGVLKIWTADLAWGLGIRYNMYHRPMASMVLGVASILTVLCLLAALALSRFLAPHRVVVPPLQRNKSNHDLADRQARARLNLEYRAEVARRAGLEGEGRAASCEAASRPQSRAVTPLPYLETVQGQRLEVPTVAAEGPPHPKAE